MRINDFILFSFGKGGIFMNIDLSKKFKTRITQYKFDDSSLDAIKNSSKGKDWPAVYILSNNKEAYIGETLNAYQRMEQHLKNKERKTLSKIYLIINDAFNKSAILDIENMLIEYFYADNKYKLQNANGGQSRLHNYYQRGLYQECFDNIWKNLRKKHLVEHSLFEIRNSDIFKFSPYKQLTGEQFDTAYQLLSDISCAMDNAKDEYQSESILIQGAAGTGKTVLAICLIKCLVDLCNKPVDFTDTQEILYDDNLYGNIDINKKIQKYINKNGALKIGFVIPVPSFRSTIQSVFKSINGLKANMVISPSQAAKTEYDILIVDEAHRLKRRKKLTNYGSHDNVNKLLNLGIDGTELDWVRKQSKLLTILFYDKQQSVKISDIRTRDFELLEKSSKPYNLSNQLRIRAGKEYIDFWEQLLNNEKNITASPSMKDYDFEIFDDPEDMFDKIRIKNTEYNGLCRMLCGFAFPWRHQMRDNSKTEYKNDYDFEIKGHKYIWNTTDKGWLTRKDSINEVGCIYTCQGYDLNYAGIILGPDIYLNVSTGKIDIHVENYYDKHSKDLNDIKQTRKNIINAYLVLLTRGILGTYIYACDRNLNNFLKKRFRK